MSDKNQSINEFIKRLKTIDVGELLEKAQTIKVEDLRYLKWKDIYSSKLFFPTIGFILAISSTIFILIPTFRKTNAIRVESKLYINELRQLPFLEKNLTNSILIKDKIIDKVNKLKTYVINKNDLIKIPRLFNQSAQISNVKLIEIRPISKESISCVYSEQGVENINPMGKTNISNNSPNRNIFPELNINQDSKIDKSIPIDHNQFKPSNKRLKDLFTKNIKDVDTQFKSNFYLLNLESSYLDSVDFIRNLQEYRISIIPVCFEPRSIISNQNSQLNNLSGSRIQNKLNIRLIINVPTE